MKRKVILVTTLVLLGGSCSESATPMAFDSGPGADAGRRGDGGDDVSVVDASSGVIPDCIPSTCADHNATCGDIDDGCGNTLPCGSCPTSSCIFGQCIEANNCGDQDPNACGTCNPLAAELGSSCGCDSLTHTCNFWGTLSCYDGNSDLEPVLQPATDDAQVGFVQVSGFLAAVSGDLHDYDRDRYEFRVNDVPGEALEPSFELDYSTSGAVTFRVLYDPDDDLIDPLPLLECTSASNNDSKLGGCELTIPAGTGSLVVDGTLFFDGSAPADSSGVWSLEIEQRATGAAAVVGTCDSYTIRYRF